jgi:hypothetical protein
VPANRSRTDRWREVLQQIAEKGGGIEFSVAHSIAEEANATPDLVWRVRVLQLSDTEIVVEQPAAAGQAVNMIDGTTLTSVMTLGQNRWMFNTKILGKTTIAGFRPTTALRLAMPTTVERCTRREFLRVSTAGLTLPTVECWPLLTPSSVVLAEAANEAMINELERSGGKQPLGFTGESTLPEVGPKFMARLMNVGGGGVGLIVDPSEASAADRAKLIWMRINLTPHIPAPLGLTAKIVHTHIDSTQSLYAGVAFEFAFNQQHRKFVLDQITRYVNMVQGTSRAAA